MVEMVVNLFYGILWKLIPAWDKWFCNIVGYKVYIKEYFANYFYQSDVT